MASPAGTSTVSLNDARLMSKSTRFGTPNVAAGNGREKAPTARAPLVRTSRSRWKRWPSGRAAAVEGADADDAAPTVSRPDDADGLIRPWVDGERSKSGRAMTVSAGSTCLTLGAPSSGAPALVSSGDQSDRSSRFQLSPHWCELEEQGTRISIRTLLRFARTEQEARRTCRRSTSRSCS